MGAYDFTKNRYSLLEGDIARAVFEDDVAQARRPALVVGEHFTIEGTLVEAWARPEECQGERSASRRAK